MMQDTVREAYRLRDPRYEAARQELLRTYRSSHHMCGTFTRVMAVQFPELRRVPGYYLDQPGGCSFGEHWWLETAEGEIVDPTADQFPLREFGHYEKYDPERDLLPKGKCPGCGVSLYTRESDYPCCKECDEALAAEYGCRTAGGPYEVDMEFECDADIVRKYGLRFKRLEEMGFFAPEPEQACA